jgi:hypothetical protein
MKIKLDDCKDFNESRHYNKHITYKLKQTYNRCKGSPYTQSSKFEKKTLKPTNCFLLLQIKKMKSGLTWVLSNQNPFQTNGKKL